MRKNTVGKMNWRSCPDAVSYTHLDVYKRQDEVNAYLERTKKRTERERIADRSVTGAFAGLSLIHI